MNRLQRLVWMLALLAGVGLRADLMSFMYPPEPDIIANTDVLDKNAPQPSPDNPIYYLPVSMGYRDFGFDLAGEKVPDPGGVLAMISKILGTQGYKVADDAHPASILILYSWGTFHQNPDARARNSFLPEMLDFLGAYKVGIRTGTRAHADPVMDAGLTPGTPDGSTIRGFLPHGMYVVTFWGFDYAAARRGESKLLWKTNVSSSARGFYLPEVLPTMLNVAAPLIGRETRRPIRIDVSKHYKPRVDLGPLQVLEEDVKPAEKK